MRIMVRAYKSSTIFFFLNSFFCIYYRLYTAVVWRTAIKIIIILCATHINILIILTIRYIHIYCNIYFVFYHCSFIACRHRVLCADSPRSSMARAKHPPNNTTFACPIQFLYYYARRRCGVYAVVVIAQ